MERVRTGSKPGTWLTLLSEEMVDTLLKLRGSELSDGMLGSDAVEREQYDGPSGSVTSKAEPVEMTAGGKPEPALKSVNHLLG